MKIGDLIVRLQVLAETHPNAEVMSVSDVRGSSPTPIVYVGVAELTNSDAKHRLALEGRSGEEFIGLGLDD